MLRRRSRVNVCDPDAAARFRLFEGAGALEVLLQPGDVVCWATGWAHHTESLGAAVEGLRGGGRGATVAGCSVSMTFRCPAL
jgi:hypothetical protein